MTIVGGGMTIEGDGLLGIGGRAIKNPPLSRRVFENYRYRINYAAF
jgi:hypothetical protein